MPTSHQTRPRPSASSGARNARKLLRLESGVRSGSAGRLFPGRYWPATAPRSWRACFSPEVGTPRQPANISPPTANTNKIETDFINSQTQTPFTDTTNLRTWNRREPQCASDGHTTGVETGKSDQPGAIPRVKRRGICRQQRRNRGGEPRRLMRLAKSRPAQRARGAKADFATRREPESQERAAAEVKRARRNTPCRNGNRHVRRARRRPPVACAGTMGVPASNRLQTMASVVFTF